MLVRGERSDYAARVTAPAARFGVTLRSLAPLLVAAVTVIALLPSASARWSADDAYVLEHLQSPEWGSRLFAFNLDRPSDDSGAWWDGIIYQRRFVRIVPSAVMALEVGILGQDPWRVHLVSIALHLFNTLLVFHLSRRWLQHAGKAALVAMLFGAHPVVVEVASWLACQPLIIAAACTLLSAEWWIRYRLTSRPAWLVATVVTLLAAVLSYEAAIFAPVLLILGDIALHRGVRPGPSGWSSRVALLSVLVPFAVLSIWNNGGVVAPETSYRPGIGEVWSVGRIDLEAYLFKALGLVDPDRPAAYWIHNATGEPVAILLLLGCLVPLAGWARRQPLALLGLLTFALFLAPPWLMRATVSALNQPTLRQIYLPLMGVATILTALFYSMRFRTVVILALPVIVAFTLLDRRPRRGPGSGAADSPRLATALALAGSDAAVPVIVTGSFEPVLDRAGCPYDLSLTWPRRAQLNLVPPTVSGAAPRLVRRGDRSFTAHADDDGFAIATRRSSAAARAQYGSGGVRFRPVPPLLLTAGRQQVGEARIEILERHGPVLRTLGYTLERPLEQYAFIAVDGCTNVRPNRPS